MASRAKSQCNEAELFYYDFLSGGPESVPEFVAGHIKECQNCLKQLDKLKDALSQASEQAEIKQEPDVRAVAQMLKLNFSYLDKPVTCETVKPFLAVLLDPAMGVRLPTPITAHVENCGQCSADLQAIHRLNLSRRQLFRFTKVLSVAPEEQGCLCAEAYYAVLALVSMDFTGIDQEALNHVCMCSYCRKLIYQYREKLLVEQRSCGDGEKFPFEEDVLEADLFDYVVPYELDPTKDWCPKKFRESLRAHVLKCPRCLGKMQALHETLYGVVDRPDSKVVTIMHAQYSDTAQIKPESGVTYHGSPLSVQVLQREDEIRQHRYHVSHGFNGKRKLTAALTSMSHFSKIGVAAAAVLAIGIVLLMSVPTAKALTIDQMYKALETVANVYIANYVPSQVDPIQEQWVSRKLKVRRVVAEGEVVFWDIHNKIMKSRILGSDSVKIIPLSPEMIGTVEKTIIGSLGLVPFENLLSVPIDAKWRRSANPEFRGVSNGIQVYDLEFTKTIPAGPTLQLKWRFFVDTTTNLPERVERYQKLDTQDVYELKYTRVVKYLSDSEIEAIIGQDHF
jgi:hypothetical protein